MTAAPALDERTDTTTETDEQRPWSVLLWDDPVNDMSYVTYVLAKVFGYDREQAAQVMLEAHTKGKAQAWSGERAEAEGHVRALHGWKLQATLEQA
jgi:ATP-dependent Clp protease adaptor protein ClpS